MSAGPATTDRPRTRAGGPSLGARAYAWLRAIDGATWTVMGIALGALVLRTVALGDRALHHDESLHATYAWYFAEGRGYEHSPMMHGPLQFHVIALFYLLFGDSDAVTRLPHAIAGSALVMTPLLFRRWFGTTGVILAALLLALSPSLLYFSRFARNDVPVALFTVLIFAAVWRYRDDGRLRWLVLLAAGLALSFAAKETAYLTAAVLLLYLNALVAHELFWSVRRGERVPIRTRVAHALWLVPTAWVLAALWDPLARIRHRLGFAERPRSVDLLVVTGTLVTPLLAAAVLIPVERLWGEPSVEGERVLGVVIVLALLGASAAVGLRWWPGRWLAVAAVFFAIVVPLYATLGTHPQGVAGAFWNSLAYWIEQHGVQRGEQPWFYYLMLVPFYEALTFWPALIGGLWLLLRPLLDRWRPSEPAGGAGARSPDGLAAMLLFWAAGTFVALSIAGEKMPWLQVPIATPLALLAAYALGRALTSAFDAAREARGSAFAWAGGGMAAVALVLLLAHTFWTNVGLNVRHPDTPVEPMIYVQTAPEVPVLAREIRERLDDGRASAVLVDQTLSLSWPWAWYLRDLPARYAPAETFQAGDFEEGTILVVLRGSLPADHPRRVEYAEQRLYHHRWWFPEETYRSITWRSFGERMFDGSLPRRWIEFALHRIDEREIGALHGEVLFP